MKIDILTLFPEMFKGPLTHSMLKKAQKKRLLDIKIYNIRNFTTDKHRTADDFSYGGGGMVLKPEPIFKAVESLKKCSRTTRPTLRPGTRGGCPDRARVILMTPDGKTFTQKIAKKFAEYKHLIFICGHYEGIDERVRKIVDEEISIGDYVLTGGELPAMVVIDAVARMVKGVVGREDAPVEDSFYKGLLDYPHYTRPREFRNMKVPDILLSGNHKKIQEWRLKMALKRTRQRRPDLLKRLAPID